MGRWGYDITAGKRERERNKEQNSPVASMRKEEACVGKPKDREECAC